MFLIFILIILLWLFFSLLSLEVKNVKNDTKVILSFGLFIKLKFDYDKFVNRFNLLKDTSKINMKNFNNYINNIFISKKLYDDLCKKINVNKFHLIKVINLKHNIIDSFSNTLFIISSSYIKSYLINKFKSIKDEKYIIVRDDTVKNEYDFHVNINIRMFFLIIIIFKNIKTLYKIFRIKRSNYGSSNSRIT